MPNDIYRWEEGGGLMHHCPHCHTPLHNPRARLNCLGQHVEWCNKYHSLFKIGNSGVCRACSHSEEHKIKRHREIAELVEELHIATGEKPRPPLSPAVSPGLPKYNQANIRNTGATKKERKDARKVARVAERVVGITAREVDRIGQILHQDEPDNKQFERSLMKDESIENNILYHAGTSNSREMRYSIINQQRSGKTELQISDAEMNRIMLELKVPTWAQASKAERSILTTLRGKITEDLTHIHKEEQETMQRKAGFWRWANRKAYNRLVANGGIWNWENGDALAPVVEQAADDIEQDAVAMDEPNEAIDHTVNINIDQDNVGHDEDHMSIMSESTDISHLTPDLSASTSRDTSASSTSRIAMSSSEDGDDDGWSVVVSKKSNKSRQQVLTSKQTERTPRTLKLSANGGLSHLGGGIGSPRTPTRPLTTLTPKGWKTAPTPRNDKFNSGFPPL